MGICYIILNFCSESKFLCCIGMTRYVCFLRRSVTQRVPSLMHFARSFPRIKRGKTMPASQNESLKKQTYLVYWRNVMVLPFAFRLRFAILEK